MAKKIIALVGDADEKESQGILKTAEAVGEEIGKSGEILICGGMGGVMRAAAKGAKKHNGTTIGVLPFDTKKEANEYIDIVIPTGMGWGMKDSITIRTADAIIAIGGGCGTLSEILLAYMHKKPIVLIRDTGGWSGKISNPLDHRKFVELETVENAAQAVKRAIEKIRENENGR